MGEKMKNKFSPPLDKGIEKYVLILIENGIETYESCQGGQGHSYPEPTIRFNGEYSDGFKALAIAIQHGLPINCLRRIWYMQDGEPIGPVWEMTFYE